MSWYSAAVGSAAMLLRAVIRSPHADCPGVGRGVGPARAGLSETARLKGGEGDPCQRLRQRGTDVGEDRGDRRGHVPHASDCGQRD
jgi:hypothetical protein